MNILRVNSIHGRDTERGRKTPRWHIALQYVKLARCLADVHFLAPFFLCVYPIFPDCGGAYDFGYILPLKLFGDDYITNS